MDYTGKKMKMSYVDEAIHREEEEDAENRFDRLPDAVVVGIFDKLSDVKSLCRCFVVCKRFSTLVPLVQTVSAKTSYVDYFSIPFSRPEFPPPSNVGGTGSINYLVVETLRPKFPHLVFQLKHIRSLNLNLVSSLNHCFVSDINAYKDSFYKWGVKFTSNLVKFTFLYATSLSEMTEAERKEDGTENNIPLREEFHRVGLAFDCLNEALLWLEILSHAISNNPTLRSITIADPKHKGVKCCLGGEKLVVLRSMIVPKFGEPCKPEYMGIGYFPALHLPVSGYVMKGVTVVYFQVYADGDPDVGTAMLDAFAEEQGVFSEAVVQIVENHVKAMFVRRANQGNGD